MDAGEKVFRFQCSLFHCQSAGTALNMRGVSMTVRCDPQLIDNLGAENCHRNPNNAATPPDANAWFAMRPEGFEPSPFGLKDRCAAVTPQPQMLSRVCVFPSL